MPTSIRRRRAARRGFTLIEVLIVIAIILALSGIVGVALFSRRDEANRDLTRTDLNTLRTAISHFYRTYDRVPTEEEGLAVLWDRSLLTNEEDEERWSLFVQSPLPNDRWGEEWIYEERSATSFRIASRGPDREEDTDDDIEVVFDFRGTGEDDPFGGGDLGGGLLGGS